MKLSRPPQSYDQQNESETRAEIERADAQNRKRGQDIELGQTERLIMRSPDGTRWSITVDNIGDVVGVALP